MLRRLLTVASVLSLLLCVCVCVLGESGDWSYRAIYTTHGFKSSRRTHGVEVWNGKLKFWWNSGFSRYEPGLSFERWQIPTFAQLPRSAWNWRFAGFQWYTRTDTYNALQYTFSDLDTPLWFVEAIGLVMPAIWVMRLFGFRRKQTKGFCRKCGYDLHASKEICPECGTPIQSTAMPEKIGENSN